jgi:hypothetical protein
MTLRERALRLRYNFIPDHLVGEILTKRWTDNAIPFLAWWSRSPCSAAPFPVSSSRLR